MIHQTPVLFFRGGLRLTGRLFRNTDRPDVRQPAIIVTGSWLTVKEQMPEVYATRFAERGYTAFTFDFTGFGESQGEPRQAEMPDRKIADLIAAAEFVSTLSCVKPGEVSHLAICASAQYEGHVSPLGRSAPWHSRATDSSDPLKTRFDDMTEAETDMITGFSATS